MNRWCQRRERRRETESLKLKRALRDVCEKMIFKSDVLYHIQQKIIFFLLNSRKRKITFHNFLILILNCFIIILKQVELHKYCIKT